MVDIPIPPKPVERTGTTTARLYVGVLATGAAAGTAAFKLTGANGVVVQGLSTTGRRGRGEYGCGGRPRPQFRFRCHRG